MRPRRAPHLATWLSLCAAACGPASTSTDATGSTTGSTTAASTDTRSTTTTTSATTDAPTSASADTTASSSSTGAPIKCMNIPVTPGGPLACDGGEELALDDACDQLAGFEYCPGDSVHRHTSVPCNTPTTLEPCTKPGAVDGCKADSECSEFASGLCAQFSDCFCHYPCARDDDCGPGAACSCAIDWAEGHENFGGPFYAVNECVPADCRSDADCGGLRCGVSVDLCDQAEGFYCRTPEDECQGHTDCLVMGIGLDRCAYSPELKHWACLEYAFCE